jgi:AAA15 family ATPase/GTPase
MMILRFEVGNFLSIKERVSLDLRATADSEHRETHTVTADKVTVLRSVALYGANGSGKSNVLTALAFMRGFVQNSSKETQQDEEIEVTPFRLSTETENAPSFFEIELIFEGVRYRYGFEATRERVHSEWLFAATSSKDYLQFGTIQGRSRIRNTDPQQCAFSLGQRAVCRRSIFARTARYSCVPHCPGEPS